MRFVILHYHFLKSAGMAIEDMLRRCFEENFVSIDTPDRDGHFSTEALVALLNSNPHLKAVSSHQFHYPVPQVGGFIFFDLCFLRDPIDRIRSIYDYFRDKPGVGDPVSEFANTLPLGEFMAALIREMPWYINDAQVNLLANGIVNDFPSAQDFDRAVAKMLRTSFLGVVDRFEESLIGGQFFLQPAFGELACWGEPVNTTVGVGSTLEKRKALLREACDPQTYSELLRLNAMDLKLVDLARTEVARRFRCVPPS
ncbi:MAG TPA: hypothetical protein VGP62_07280 [Bryobacteraceae bacterium]|nr:hypothetical protein [Bryobacteraceae bacterium]